MQFVNDKKKELVKCSGKTKTVIDSDRLMMSSEEESTRGECVNSKYYVKLCIIFFMVDTITCIIYDTCQNAISRCLRGRTAVELMGHFNDLDLLRQHVILIYYTILTNYNHRLKCILGSLIKIT